MKKSTDRTSEIDFLVAMAQGNELKDEYLSVIWTMSLVLLVESLSVLYLVLSCIII